MMRLSVWFLVLLLLAICYCANPIAPTGGPKDVDPPKIDSAKSTPNYQTNFTKQPIVLTFDEWIKLDKPNQIVLSPPMRKKPNFVQRGKYIRVEWPEEEELLDSVTYTINFGDAIKDLNEGNTLKDFRFVFATGSVLDSARVTASITDVLTLEPLENITVMLYVTTSDSIVYQEPPYYFAKTNKEGTCLIENVRPGHYKVFALADGNQNYLFDNAGEKIGYLDSTIMVSDTQTARVSLKMFQELLPYKIIRRRLNQNVVHFTFNRSPNAIQLESAYQPPLIERQQDSLRLWLDADVPDPWLFYLIDTMGFRDTTNLYQDSTERMELPVALAGTLSTANHPAEFPWIWSFNQPVMALDTGLLQITLADSTHQPVPYVWVIDSSFTRNVNVKGDWKPDMKYEARLLPGALTGRAGAQTDTIQLTLRTAKVEDLANLIVEVDSLDPNKQYLAQLLTKDNVVREYRIAKKSQETISWRQLKPAEYILRIIADENANGVWDPGDYLRLRHPEPVQIQPIQDLRANWDLAVRFNWKSSGS